MLNQVVLIGRLAADPEIRYLAGGTPVGRFRLAVQRPRRSDGQDPGADFIDIVVWRRQAEVVAEHLAKGSLVAVEGRIQVRDYEANGQRRRAFEVVARTVRFLSPPSGKGRGAAKGSEEAPEGWQEVELEEVPF